MFSLLLVYLLITQAKVFVPVPLQQLSFLMYCWYCLCLWNKGNRFRMRRLWILWRHEYDVIVTWRHRWRHKSSHRRHIPIGSLLNIFNSPELVANKQIITNTRKKKKNNTLNKYWMFRQQIRQMYHRWRPQRHQAKEHNTLYTCCEHVNVRGYGVQEFSITYSNLMTR